VFALALAPIVVAIAWIDETWRALGVSATFIAISLAAMVDVRQRRLPDVLTVPGALVSIATVVPVTAAEGTAVGVDVATSVALGAAAFAGPLLVLHLVSPAGMGFGDVKAGVALGTAIGLIDTASSLVGLFVGSLIAASAGLVTRQRHVPFGPSLVIGAAVALVIARARGVSPVG